MFNKAVKLAKAMEAAEKEVRDLQYMPSMGVHQLGKMTATKQNSRRIPNPFPNPPKTTRCYQCGAQHKPTDCKFRDTEYNLRKERTHC